MPSAASAKPEKAPPAEASGVPPPAAGAADNSPVRQILVIIEHKIRNLEKRKSKLTSYRDLQKSGKELNADQKVAVAKYDEVTQTLEFARDMCKQVTSIAVTSERDAKRQAKKDAWIRTAAETTKIRDVLLVLDALVQMGNDGAREDFLQGSNGAAKLTQEDLKILDDLYPEVTPRHEPNDEGSPAFPSQAMKAAEHLYSIIDGRQKEILGTTYLHIKEIITAIHQCGYFDKSEVETVPIEEEQALLPEPVPEELSQPEEMQPSPPLVYPPPPHTLPSPAPLAPAPGVVPAPAYPLRPLPPITLQEVEHAYFSQQYAQQRPITEVIGSQNFFFLQESEIDSPSSTPQPVVQTAPPGPIPTQTFTNQNFIQINARVAPEPGVLPPQPHFPVPADLPAFPVQGLPPRALPHPLERLLPQPVPHTMMHTSPPSPPLREEPVQPPPAPTPPAQPAPAPEVASNNNDDEWNESPDRDEDAEQPQGDGDSQNNRNRRNRKFNRGAGREQSNGFRGGRGGYRQSGDYQPRQNDNYQSRQNDNYQGRQNNGYQGRHNDGYQPRQTDGYQGRNSDEYQSRRGDNYQARQNSEGYHSRQNNGSYQRRDDNYQPRNSSRNRNGDSANDNGTRDKYESSQGGFQGGFKSRGRGGGPRGGFRSGPPRSARPPPPFASKQTSNSEQ